MDMISSDQVMAYLEFLEGGCGNPDIRIKRRCVMMHSGLHFIPLAEDGATTCRHFAGYSHMT